ncbi:class I SAM-dependent methyltransferase [Rhodanobacter sp. Si-c]|uniref:Class I SAM-dependent methyltransferase n=1 Tax=Rhodanobacter lycopersici TaxID=3162487 RepID=A0ABV3QCB5_9GAMM
MEVSFVLDEEKADLRIEPVQAVDAQVSTVVAGTALEGGIGNLVRRAGAHAWQFIHGSPVDVVAQRNGQVPSADRWTEFAHFPQRERGLVLRAGERLHLPIVHAAAEPILWMRCLRALPRISDDGLDVEVWCGCDDDAARMLLSQRLENAHAMASLREVTINLPVPVGCALRIEIRCEPGPHGDPSADWLGLLGLVVCARGEFDLLRARNQHAWRLQNEIAHFSRVYSDDFYRDRHTERRASGGGSPPPRALPPRPVDRVTVTDMRAALHAHLHGVMPRIGENAFAYANRMLAMAIPARPPNFPARLRALSAQHPGRPLRMLALCAGEAAIEGGILETAGVPVELCIVDVNASLLDQATQRMPPTVTVDRVLGDANDIGPQLGQFDVVNITSGLHHLVELERVLAAIAEILSPGGEFWLIGEQVGRNGNRLWPEALALADRIFTDWPEAKRRNHNTGKVDAAIPDVDFSAGCFEGIRSQDIIGQLERHFLPVDCYLRNAFLWRLVDVAYAANFDLDDEADRKLLERAVVEEAMHWAQGGRGTEMHAVYRSKWAGVLELVTDSRARGSYRD